MKYLMRTFAFGCAIVLVGGLVGSAMQQVTEPPPGSIRLLSGYRHQKEQGIDTTVGKIWKDGGPVIRYDIDSFSALAGNYAQHHKRSDPYLWYKEQEFQGNTAQVLLTKDRKLIVTFPFAAPRGETIFANFIGKVATEEQLAEVLLMLMTYSPPKDAK
jgi:hypothetical protein